MSYNSLIINKLQADRYLARLLEKTISEVKHEAIQQAKTLSSGFTRLTWYSSCFTDNYQDVCSKLKREDIRFAKAIIQLLKQNDVIREMSDIFVRDMFNNLSDERIKNIGRILAKPGANFTASTVTNRSFSYSIAVAVSMSIGIKSEINRSLTVWAGRGVFSAGIYGKVQIAADAADRLAKKNPTFYHALYDVELEMLFYLIEPIINRVDNFARSLKTDEDIVSDILRITQ